MVIRVKPVSKFIILTLTLLLLLSSSITVRSSDPVVSDEPESEQTDDLDELFAVDEEGTEGNQEQQSEAEVVSKAQRIVLELNIDSAKRVIDGNEYVMVLGYAPWCPRSAELMPQFAEAATILKEIGSPLLMAKVDADRYPKVASQLEIKGFPTLLLFTNGSSQPYTGGFSAEDIVLWARKKTGVPVIRIESVNEANEFLKKHHTFVIGLFDKFEGSSHEQFIKAAALDNDIQFVETKNTEAAKVLYPDIKGSAIFVGIVKSEPERYTAFEGPYETEKILQFLDGNKFPLVTRLTETNSAKVYSGTLKTQVMIFAKADDFEKLVQPLEDIGRKFKSKIMLIYIDIANENLAMPFLTLFGTENSTNVVVAAFDTKENQKFLLESEPSARNIEEFCSGLLDGTASPYFKSQPIPDNTNASVLAVVGKTLDEIVLSNSKNVLLEVYTPWCLNCETVSKKVEKLAKHFKGLDSLVFARIDASVNEHPKLQVDDYPAVLLYKAGEKDEPIQLSTKSSSKDMAMLINKELKQKEETTKDEL